MESLAESLSNKAAQVVVDTVFFTVKADFCERLVGELQLGFLSLSLTVL